jgi:hypothetical protein
MYRLDGKMRIYKEQYGISSTVKCSFEQSRYRFDNKMRIEQYGYRLDSKMLIWEQSSIGSMIKCSFENKVDYLTDNYASEAK